MLRKTLFAENEAAWTKRVGAYLVDALIAAGVCLGIFWLGKMGWERYQQAAGYSAWGVWIVTGGSVALLVSLFFYMALALCSAMQVWLTKGYTLGKWLLGLRLEKVNGRRIGLGTVVLRELLLKGVLNGLTLGGMNVLSLLWLLLAPNQRTLVDILSATRVVKSR